MNTGMIRVRSVKILTTLSVVLATTTAYALVCPVYLQEDAFVRVFHNVTPASEVTVTSLREELKVIVDRTESRSFLHRLKILCSKTNGVVFGLRDVPPEGKEFVTDTWYWRSFKNADEKGSTKFRAVLRARLYDEVHEGVPVSSLESAKPGVHVPMHPVPLADVSADVYRKFEFKVGHPYEIESEMSGQIPGVVDKPGVVLPERDILLLLDNPKSFAENRDRIYREGLLLSKKGKLVNSPVVLDEMLKRVAELHVLSPEPVGPPVVRIRYKREAWQAMFKTIDPISRIETKIPVQITFDREVKLEDFTSTTALSFDDSNFALTKGGEKAPVSVVEFKVPLAYSKLTDEELRAIGLGGLAEMRNDYLALSSVESAVRNSGKQTNGLRELKPAH
jgi:hypothetical protein